MEAKSNKIEVVKPNINLSSSRYIVNGGKIIYPFSNIKSIGSVVANKIIEERIKGEFVDIYDAFSRLFIAGVGKKNLEILIKASVFDIFNYNRATLIYNLDSLFNYAELTKDIDPSLVMRPDIIIREEYDKLYLLEMEKEVFGFYLSNHPTTFYIKDNSDSILLRDVSKYFSRIVSTLILVDKIKVIKTKKGEEMAFVTGSDSTATLEYTFFPRVYKLFSDIKPGDLLKVVGKVEKRLDQIQIVASKIEYLKGFDDDEK